MSESEARMSESEAGNSGEEEQDGVSESAGAAARADEGLSVAGDCSEEPLAGEERGGERRLLPARALLALLIFLALTLALLFLLTGREEKGAGEGAQLPPGQAVRIGSEAFITRREVEAAIPSVYAASVFAGNPLTPVLPDPPEFLACARAVRAQRAPGQPLLRCKRAYQALREQAVVGLTRALWQELELKRRGLRVSEAQLERRFRQQQKEQFGSRQEFELALKEAGLSEQEARKQLRDQLVGEALQRDYNKGVRPPTERQLREVYQRSGENLNQPPRRALTLIFTASKARAERALKRLRAGDNPTRITRLLGAPGGPPTPNFSASKQSLPAEVRQQIFRARRGETVGPLKYKTGWVAVKIRGIIPARLASFANSRAAIRDELLRSVREERALQFELEISKRWRARTVCRRFYRPVAVCGNTPAPKAPATPPGEEGAAPSTRRP